MQYPMSNMKEHRLLRWVRNGLVSLRECLESVCVCEYRVESVNGWGGGWQGCGMGNSGIGKGSTLLGVGQGSSCDH